MIQSNGKPPGEDTETDQFSIFKSYFDTKLDSLKGKLFLKLSLQSSVKGAMQKKSASSLRQTKCSISSILTF